MSCLEVRRALATEPALGDPRLTGHLRTCTECAAAASRARRFEQRLREAARVSVPENLDSRILLRQSFRARPARARRRRALALAASVLLGLGVALGLAGRPAPPSSALQNEVVDLVNAASYALAATGPVSGEQVAAALRPVGLRLSSPIGAVTFASRCYVQGRLAGHIVMRGETAPVTVLLIPDERVPARETIRRGHLSGVLLPAERGTIAVLGAPGERLDPVVARIRSSVLWSG